MFASVREFFLLEKARARAGAGESIVAEPSLLEAANRRRRAAEELVGPSTAVAALVLYRDALRFVARARAGGEDAIAKSLDALGERRSKPLREALEALRSDDPLAFDRLSEPEVALLRENVDDLFAWLDGTLRTRSIRELRIMRALRLAGAALAVVLVGRLAFKAIFVPRNQALHKPVFASSRYEGTPEPAALTDGDRRKLGVHTIVENEPWVRVDLASTYKVKTIRVYNRTDCCVDEILPLIVEVGTENDPAPFIAERSETFEVWEIDVGGHPASTVKIHSRRKSYIALAEVEVLGEP